MVKIFYLRPKNFLSDLIPNFDSPSENYSNQGFSEDDLGKTSQFIPVDNDPLSQSMDTPDDPETTIYPEVPECTIVEEESDPNMSTDDFVILIEEECSQDITVSPSTSTSKKSNRLSPNVWKPELSSSQSTSKTLSKKAKRLDLYLKPIQKKKRQKIDNIPSTTEASIVRVETSPIEDINPFVELELRISPPDIPTFDDDFEPYLPQNDDVGFQDDIEPIQQEIEIENIPVQKESEIQVFNAETALEKEKNVQTEIWNFIEQEKYTNFSEILNSECQFHDSIASNFVSLLQLAAKKGLLLENEDEDLGDILIRNCNI